MIFVLLPSKLNIVQTQFGVHLVQVTGISKKVQKGKKLFISTEM